jgi:hypothetical protein
MKLILKMYKIAVVKAKDHLAEAKAALERAESSPNFKAFKSEWRRFLLEINGVHTKLEQGAKQNPQSRQWYGERKKECRKDPLLLYVKQARNADEHGLKDVIEHKPGHVIIGKSGEDVHLRNFQSGPEGFQGEIEAIAGVFPTVDIQPSRPILVTVQDDRYVNSFDPPKEHMGKTLKDTSPLAVAKLALQYHETLADDAEKLVI